MGPNSRCADHVRLCPEPRDHGCGVFHPYLKGQGGENQSDRSPSRTGSYWEALLDHQNLKVEKIPKYSHSADGLNPTSTYKMPTGSSPPHFGSQGAQHLSLPPCLLCPCSIGLNLLGTLRVKAYPASRGRSSQGIHPQLSLPFPSAVHFLHRPVSRPCSILGHCTMSLCSFKCGTQTQTQNCRCHSDWSKPEWTVTPPYTLNLY